MTRLARPGRTPGEPAVEPRPGLADVPAFTVAGLRGDLGPEGAAAIPSLWARLVERLPLPGQEERWTTIGVAWRVAGGPLAYLAGVALGTDAPPPAGYDTVTVPGGRYKVFRVTLAGGPVGPQMQAAMGRIWGALLPASGVAVAAGPLFERYEGPTTPDQAGATVDVHIPTGP